MRGYRMALVPATAVRRDIDRPTLVRRIKTLTHGRTARVTNLWLSLRACLPFRRSVRLCACTRRSVRACMRVRVHVCAVVFNFVVV